MRHEGPYRHYIPDIQLSIERHTGNVPPDGCYYVLREGNILGKYRSLKKAEELFRQVVKESGYRPEVKERPPKSVSDLSIEHYLDAKDLYWAESYKFRGTGGKGRRGSV